jgi:hypothetical protein
MYVTLKATMRQYSAWPMVKALEQSMENRLQLLPEEAVPALVDGVKFVTVNMIGDC